MRGMSTPEVSMARNEEATDEDIGGPHPWGEGRYRRGGQPIDRSVLAPPGASLHPKGPVSTPVTRKDYEFPGEEADHTGCSEPPGAEAG